MYKSGVISESFDISSVKRLLISIRKLMVTCICCMMLWLLLYALSRIMPLAKPETRNTVNSTIMLVMRRILENVTILRLESFPWLIAVPPPRSYVV